MKKITKILVLILLVLPIYVFADMGAPILPDYDVVVSNPNGAAYYDLYNEKKVGTIEYDTQIKVTYNAHESEHAIFEYNDKKYYIQSSDIMPLKDEFSLEEDVVEKTDETEIKVFDSKNKEGIKMYKGPSKWYDEVGIIPNGDTATALYYISGGFDYSDGVTWYYVNYNGINGWVFFYEGGIGLLPETTEPFFMKADVKVNLAGDNTKKTVIPYETKITNYYVTDAHSNALGFVYAEYDGQYYLLNRYSDGAYEDNEEYVVVETVNLYEQGSEDSKVIDIVPKGTRIKAISRVSERYGFQAIKVNYNGKIGWICYGWEDRLVWNSSYYDEYIKEQEKENAEEQKPEKDENSNLNKEEQKPIEDNEKENDKHKENKKISSVEVLYICIGVAIVLSITMIVTIKLINKKKNKNNILDNSLENKQNVELNNSDNNITYVEQYPQEQSDIINTEIKEETNKTNDIINDVSDNKL